ncbi:MAG: hypothetical protein K6G47_12760 [Clostridia bacterium]|nr:hypothetical protein [Clostridia bacterium]
MKKRKLIISVLLSVVIAVTTVGCSFNKKDLEEDKVVITESDVIELVEKVGTGLLRRDLSGFEDISVNFDPDSVDMEESEGSDDYTYVRSAWYDTFSYEINSVYVGDGYATADLVFSFMDTRIGGSKGLLKDEWIEAIQNSDEIATTTLMIEMEYDDGLLVSNMEEVVDDYLNIKDDITIRTINYEDIISFDITDRPANKDAVITLSFGDEASIEGDEIAIEVVAPSGNAIYDSTVYFTSNGQETLTLSPKSYGNADGMFEEDVYTVNAEINGATVSGSFTPTTPKPDPVMSDDGTFLAFASEEGFKTCSEEVYGINQYGVYRSEYFGFEITYPESYVAMTEQKLNNNFGLELVLYKNDYNMALMLIINLEDAETKAANYYGDSKVEVNGVTMYTEIYVSDTGSTTIYVIVKENNVFFLSTFTGSEAQEEILAGIKAIQESDS